MEVILGGDCIVARGDSLELETLSVSALEAWLQILSLERKRLLVAAAALESLILRLEI